MMGQHRSSWLDDRKAPGMDALQLAHRVAIIGLVLGVALPLVAGPVSDLVKYWREKRPRPSAMPTSEDLNGGGELDVGTWSISPERDQYIARRARGYLAAAGAGLLVFAGSFVLAAYQDEAKQTAVREWRWLGLGEVCLGVVIGAYSLMPYVSARNAYRSRRVATAAARVDKALADASRAKPPLQLPDLFQLNRRQLDEYQVMTQRQQRSAFVWAQIASIFAFLVLVAGIIAALSGDSNVGRYVSGGLSALGALLSGFLAKTFFATVKDANKQMNLYYLEPQRTGRLLAVERIIGKLPDTSDATLVSTIVTAVLGWDMPDDHPAAPDDTATDGRPAGSIDGSGADPAAKPADAAASQGDTTSDNAGDEEAADKPATR
jgi:hypothetical protein